MINLRDGQITDLLPAEIASDIETQCLSYALQQEHQRLMLQADQTRTLSMIEELPEAILDVLAIELQTPYYQEDMDLETKQNIIKQTLQWHTRAGTPSAVSELVATVFGVGRIVEWFNYEEGPFTPGTFDIETSAQMTPDIVEYFLQVILRVKNTRSHIRRILIDRAIGMDERIAIGGWTSPEEYVLNSQDSENDISMSNQMASGCISSPAGKIHNIMDPTSFEANMIARAGVAISAVGTKTTIYNGNTIESSIVSHAALVATGIKIETKITI